MICIGTRWSACRSYRANLRTMYQRWSQRSSYDASKYTNERYLTTPEKKAKIANLRSRSRTAEKSIAKLQEQVRKLTKEQGETVGDVESDLIQIMSENTDSIRSTYSEGTFARLFWE